MVEQNLSTEVENLPSRSTKDVSRDGSGSFYLQFTEEVWTILELVWTLQSLDKTIDLRAYGKWLLTLPSPSLLINMTPLVLSGVRLDMPDGNV